MTTKQNIQHRILGATIVAALTFSGAAHAQQDPQFSQNMHNRLFINPGVAGSNNAICGTLFARQQWVGFDGKPETYLLSVHMPLSMVTTLPLGAGLSVYSDRLGQMSYFGFKASGAYRLGVGPGTLGAGLSLGMVSLKMGNSWVALDDYTLDPSIPDVGTAKSAFDMDLGAYYEIQDKLYLGISMMHLPASTMEKTLNANDVFSYKVARHYYIMAGYTYNFTGSLPLSVEPSVYVKTDGSSTQMDFNALVYWDNTFWLGASYRLQDAIAPMIGMRKKIPNSRLIGKVGYSYDVTTSTLKNFSNGSHEIMLGMCYDLSEDDKKQKVKSVIFLK